LDSNQRGIHQAYTDSLKAGARLFVCESSRKIGKSFWLGGPALERWHDQPGGRVNCAAPTAQEASEITVPIMSQLADMCRPSRRPVWKRALGHWVFPNGAYIVLFGADDQAGADRGRGPE